MNLLIDDTAGWEHIGAFPVGDEQRNYYIAPAPHRALIVCRHGLRLGNLRGRIADASVGYDRGEPGFARYPGREQTKITIYAQVGGRSQSQLRLVLRDAPKGE